jgi:hypothetical protein
MTAVTTLRVAALAVSRKPASRWASRGWAASAVLPAPPDAAPGTRLGPEGDVETWYAGPAEIALHPGDTAHHRDNLASERPSVWVALRAGACDVVAATVDPYEGEALAGDPGLVVEAVAMPEALQAVLADFVARFHVERPFEKRQRKRADPHALGRRAPGGGG